jgi:hypothetical protein
MINKETSEHYVWGGICDGWHLVKTAQLSMIHERMPSDSFSNKALLFHKQIK